MASRNARIFVQGKEAGILSELERNVHYVFEYLESYQGPEVSCTMPVSTGQYSFQGFPPFFEGLLPEGIQLEGLLRRSKLDRNDLFAQLMAVGEDVVGAVSIKEIIS